MSNSNLISDPSGLYMIGSLGTVSKRDAYYSAGWAQYCAQRFRASIIHNVLKDKIPSRTLQHKDINCLYMLYPPGGRHNLYGGPDGYKEIFEAIKDLSERATKMIAIGASIDVYNKRVPDELKVTNKNCGELETDLVHYDTNDFVIGDSHALSVVFPTRARVTALQLTEGETLYRFMTRKSHDYLDRFCVTGEPQNLIIKFGDIDLRFNWSELSNFRRSIVEMWERYIMSTLVPVLVRENRTINLVVCLPNPVEHEDREIPNSGLKDGRPFNGTQSVRAMLRDEYRSIIADEIAEMANSINCISKFGLLEMRDGIYTSPKDYAEKAMEKPRSVHLAPHSYYSNNQKLWKLTKL